MKLASRSVRAVGIAVGVVVLTGVAAVSCFVGAVWLDIHRVKPYVRITKDQVASDVRQHLPLGSSRKQVEEFLGSKGIEHSYVPESPDMPEYSNADMCLIRDAAHTWFIRTDIQLVFSFDNQERLNKIVIKEINTGL